MDDDIEKLAGALREVSFWGLLRAIGLMALLIPLLGLLRLSRWLDPRRRGTRAQDKRSAPFRSANE
jgi:hypothetical protein